MYKMGDIRANETGHVWCLNIFGDWQPYHGTDGKQMINDAIKQFEFGVPRCATMAGRVETLEERVTSITEVLEDAQTCMATMVNLINELETAIYGD